MIFPSIPLSAGLACIMIRLLFFMLHLLCFHGLTLFAQINETFSDGNFSVDPAWNGTAGSWIVNASGQLQSSNTNANSTFYLSTPNKLAVMTEWKFDVRLNFNTSGSNYADIFLIASAPDLSQNATCGYFVRIGNTQDEVSLYRKDADGLSVKLIDGADGLTNKSDNDLSIKVTRSNGYRFTLYRDTSGTAARFLEEGSIIDSSYLMAAYFGILVRQSTSGFFQKHYFDNVMVSPFIPDVSPPSIRSLMAATSASLDILFSEPVEAQSAEEASNYSVDNGIGVPSVAVCDHQNPSLVHLLFNKEFPNGVNLVLTVNGVCDLNKNCIAGVQSLFSFYTARRFDIVIDEIMADPSPPVGLPNAEFIELKNCSGRILRVGGWKIVNRFSTGTLPDYTFPPDSFLILSSPASVQMLAPYGKVIGVQGFPSLDNEGGQISLLSKEGRTIHAVAYASSWYGNPAKQDGGWSLEMIDVSNPCSGITNWKTSTDNNGGTPGRINAVDARNPDETPPVLLRTHALDSVSLACIFDEPLDSAAAANGVFTLSHSGKALAAYPQSPLFNEVILHLRSPLTVTLIDTLTVQSITDCKGNGIGVHNTARAGLDAAVAPGDIVINEIHFNPRPGAFDYVELYNKSKKIIDASKMYIGNRSATVQIAALKKISESRRLIFPGDYIVLTEDAVSLKKEYLVKDPGSVFVIASLPSYPDDEGDVVLCDEQGNKVDEVVYDEEWQFALITNREGIALERLDPAGPSGNAGNWHSAAFTAGFGTPGYQNSEYLQKESAMATITVEPRSFSPDNDAQDDLAWIGYHMEEPGYVANISVYDAPGRPVRYLVKNDLLGLNGRWQWDGLNEQKLQLPIGVYIIYTEIFNLKGKVRRFRNTIVLARKI